MDYIYLIILCVLGLIICGGLYSCYVKVIQCRNTLYEAKSGIDIQFKKRYDLLPNILTIAAKFMEHEKEIFTKITELRTMAMNAPSGSNEALQLNAKLDSVLGQLKVSMENYPTLKSDETMLQVMRTYSEVEEHIAAARRFYNSALTQFNNAIMIFPSSLFKGYVQDAIGSKYYECDNSKKVTIQAKDYLN